MIKIEFIRYFKMHIIKYYDFYLLSQIAITIYFNNIIVLLLFIVL